MKFKILVTNEGKHPAYKWAELAADEIIEISEQAPETLVREAREFRENLVRLLTDHHQQMMDHEQAQIKDGKHQMHLPLETEEHAEKVVDQIRDIAKGKSFAKHFSQDHVREHLNTICNKYFKSAKLVERQHYHSEQEQVKNN